MNGKRLAQEPLREPHAETAEPGPSKSAPARGKEPGLHRNLPQFMPKGSQFRTYNLLDTVHTACDCTYMPKRPIQLRVDEADLENWRAKAAEQGQDLSEWIRGRCNGSSDHEDVPSARDVGATRRSTPAVDRPEKRSRRRGHSTLRQIEDVTHDTLRSTLELAGSCRHGKKFGRVCLDCGGIAKEGIR